MGANPILLDPRLAQVAFTRPIENAVNIPARELTKRTYELPEPTEKVTVADVGADAQLAVHALRRSGRQSVLTKEWKFGVASSRPPLQLWSPSAFLAEMTAGLTPGLALDIGCGTGRDAVYLANRGWHVTGVDILPDALERAAALEKRYRNSNAPIRWVQSNVQEWKDRLPDDIGSTPAQPFDFVYAVRFVARETFATACRQLSPKGRLIIEAFTPTHRARHGKPASDQNVLNAADLEQIAAGMKIEVCREVWHRDIHLAQLCAIAR